MTSASDNSNRLARLAQLRPVEGLPREAIRAFAERADFETYDRGELLRDQNAPVDAAIFVIDGQVKVVAPRLDDAEIILGIFGPRHPSGGLGLFDETYPGRIEALTTVVTAEIPPRGLRRLLSEHDVNLERFLEVTSERARYLARRLHDATVRPAERRLALVFRMFLEYWGRSLEDGEGEFVPLRIRRRDLADLINTRTETAIRLVRDWERSGLIRTESDGFVIPDPDQLDTVIAGA